MTGIEVVAIAAVTKGVDLLLGELKATLEEIRERRKDDPDAKQLSVLPEGINATTREETLPWAVKNLRLTDDPKEVAFLLAKIEAFLFNRRHQLNIYNKMGILTPQHIMHELRAAEDGIIDNGQKLKNFIERVYSHKVSIVGLD